MLFLFFRDKVKSVLKLFEIMHKPNTYEIGRILASSGFRKLQLELPQDSSWGVDWALVKIEARNSYVSNYIGDFKTTIRPIAARFSWNPRGSYQSSPRHRYPLVGLILDPTPGRATSSLGEIGVLTYVCNSAVATGMPYSSGDGQPALPLVMPKES